MHKVSSVYAHQLTQITEITQYIMAVMFFNILSKKYVGKIVRVYFSVHFYLYIYRFFINFTA